MPKKYGTKRRNRRSRKSGGGLEAYNEGGPYVNNMVNTTNGGGRKRSRKTRRHHRGGMMAHLNPASVGADMSTSGGAGFENSIGLGLPNGLGSLDAQADVIFKDLDVPSTYKLQPLEGTLTGGRRRRHSKRRRGGYLGQVVNQAIVPFALLGAQHMYGKRKTRKDKRHRRR